jgi:hypothetical protein
MAPSRIGSTNTTSLSSVTSDTSNAPAAPTASGPKPAPRSAADDARTVLEPFNDVASKAAFAGLGTGPQAPMAGPTSNASRFEIEQALAKQELQEKALANLTPILGAALKQKGRIHDGTFLTSRDQSDLKDALRKLPPEMIRDAVREAVQRAFPKADGAKLEALTADTMRELKGITTSDMAREYKDFISEKITQGATRFREVAKDPAQLEAMRARLETLSPAERDATLSALGVPPGNSRPTASQLASAMNARAALMDRSAKDLANASGADHTLFRISKYPGLEEAFMKAKGIDPNSVGGRAVHTAMSEAHGEAVKREVLDISLVIGSAAVGGALVGAAALGTGAAVAVAAPGTLLNASRKLGAADTSVNDARAGESAGVMGRGAVKDAERHRTLTVAAAVAEAVAPVGGHAIGHALHAQGAVKTAVVEGSLAAGILAGEHAAESHSTGRPSGKDATRP